MIQWLAHLCPCAFAISESQCGKTNFSICDMVVVSDFLRQMSNIYLHIYFIIDQYPRGPRSRGDAYSSTDTSLRLMHLNVKIPNFRKPNTTSKVKNRI